MNGDEILDVLKQIRDEARQTNVRLKSVEGRIEQTNVRLESLEGRVEQTNVRLESLEGHAAQTNVRLESLEGRFVFLEKRVSKGFENLTEKMNELESNISSELADLSKAVGLISDLLTARMEDHNLLIRLEGRVSLLESRNPPE